MDAWNPATFDGDLRSTLSDSSELIADFQYRARALMDEHLNSDPYERLKPNPLHTAYSDLLENVVAPLVQSRRVRVWHYSRLLNVEVVAMRSRLVASSLAGLEERLAALVGRGLLAESEARSVFAESPLHAQEMIRAGRFWTVSVPLPSSDHGVQPLLRTWGGESAHFWLEDSALAEKLTRIGMPRIVEVEAELRDEFNAFTVADTVLESWAKHLGAPATIGGSDLAITGCLASARVLAVHTQGDGKFEEVGATYPACCENLRNQ